MDLSQIDSIIFDLGGVIVNLDPDRTVRALQANVPGVEPDTFNGKVHQLWFYSEYEVGKISSDEFVAAFNEHHASKVSRTEFERAWNAMILDFPPERIELIRKLRREGRRIFLLSNTNEMHETYFAGEFQSKFGHHFDELFDQTFYSHKLGLRKPHTEVFERVIELTAVTPARTLFIDDSEQHIVGARRAGLNAFHLRRSMILEEVFRSVFE